MRHERMYRDIVETSPDGIWVIDLDGRTRYANPSLAAMYGVAVKDMADVTVFDTLDDAGREQFRGHLQDLRRGHFNEAAVECLFHDRDGSPRWMLLQESPHYDTAGVIVGAVHWFSDFTERRQVNLELAESRAQLAEAQRIARVGSFSWDVAVDSITLSEQLAQMLGLAEPEARRTYEASWPSPTPTTAVPWTPACVARYGPGSVSPS